jgi:hypothetical protein
MSGKKIRRVGGTMNITSQGDYTMYATENDITLNAANKVQFKGTQGGTQLGNYNPPPEKKNTILKKFLVHFIRHKDYKGEYGFDWLREEYLYPIETVTHNNNAVAINAAKPLCLDTAKLKAEYKKDVLNPIQPYGVAYYPAWLSIFPNTTTAQFAHGSTMHKNGVNLDVQIDQLEELLNDGTIISFECTEPHIKISPKTIGIADVIAGGKKTRTINGKTIKYYKLPQKINIKCEGGVLKAHAQIKVFATLDKQKEEVGKLMLYKNNVIPKMEIVMINLITKTGSKTSIQKDLIADYEYNFKRAGYNQALIRSEVTVYNDFDINTLPATDADVQRFKSHYTSGSISVDTDVFLNDAVKLYNKFGKFNAGTGGIDGSGNKKTYLFFTELSASGGTRGNASCEYGSHTKPAVWGNAFIVYKDGLINRRTILHEAAHSMGLQHTFSAGSLSDGLAAPALTFYQGYTDNIMDYTWQQGTGNDNPYNGKDQMRSFFKWQWDALRTDRSLIHRY